VSKRMRWGVLATLLGAAVAVAALVGSAGHAATSATKPIVIGWAFDRAGQMAPFDDPALAAAKIRIAQINKKGGVNKRKLVIKTCDTQNNNATTAKACAVKLLGQGAKIIFTTCDVDFATPVVQAAINKGVLAIAPCIGTDQMGPKRFGSKGKLAFSFGNVAQDEGSAMAEYARSRGWKSASLATNNLLVYFKNVVQAFDKRFRQLGGKIVTRESYQTGANNVQTAVTRLNQHKADVIVTSTSFGELPALVSGLRSLGNKTPIINSWAGDGTYWVTKNPKVTNYYCVTYASVFGDDPSKDVRSMISALKKTGSPPGTGGFLGGASRRSSGPMAPRRARRSPRRSSSSRTCLCSAARSASPRSCTPCSAASTG
jgi:branched-chain amino acid transport system substrate-binding protein